MSFKPKSTRLSYNINGLEWRAWDEIFTLYNAALDNPRLFSVDGVVDANPNSYFVSPIGDLESPHREETKEPKFWFDLIQTNKTNYKTMANFRLVLLGVREMFQDSGDVTSLLNDNTLKLQSPMFRSRVSLSGYF